MLLVSRHMHPLSPALSHNRIRVVAKLTTTSTPKQSLFRFVLFWRQDRSLDTALAVLELSIQTRLFSSSQRYLCLQSPGIKGCATMPGYFYFITGYPSLHQPLAVRKHLFYLLSTSADKCCWTQLSFHIMVFDLFLPSQPTMYQKLMLLERTSNTEHLTITCIQCQSMCLGWRDAAEDSNSVPNACIRWLTTAYYVCITGTQTHKYFKKL